MTGSGRVAKGAKEILDELNIQQVCPEDFLNKSYSGAVYSMPRSSDYYEMAGGKFEQNLFYSSPQNFKSSFVKFASEADILIACAYWNPSAPKLFTKEEMRNQHFKIKIIADITCDINGSIPSTLRPSTIYDPFYDYNPLTEETEPSFSSDKNITVMAIDNLPTELPRDASEFFGLQLIEYVFPALIEGANKEVLSDSIIAQEGHLSSKFSYLQKFVEEINEPL